MNSKKRKGVTMGVRGGTVPPWPQKAVSKLLKYRLLSANVELSVVSKKHQYFTNCSETLSTGCSEVGALGGDIL